MALKAGRVGVAPDQVDPYGKISGGGGGGYVLPVASAETLGGVKVGNGLTMTDGVLSSDNPTPYTLPTASADTLGGVKVGTGLTITDGVLSAAGGGEPIFKLWKVLSGIKGGTTSNMKETFIGNNTSYAIPSGYTPIIAIGCDTSSGYPVGAILTSGVWYDSIHYKILSWNSNENAIYDVYVVLVKTSAFESYTP